MSERANIVVPQYRLPDDATWEQLARAAVEWHRHAAMGRPCPPPSDLWRWREEGPNAWLCAEWGDYVPDRSGDEDRTDYGMVVTRAPDGRWIWKMYGPARAVLSGLTTETIYWLHAQREYYRAASWADPRDAVADAEVWLDANVRAWRDGVTYEDRPLVRREPVSEEVSDE